MKILLLANHVPFISGGSRYHIRGLEQALKQNGHQVETLLLPFRFHPIADIERQMQYCQQLDFNAPNGIKIDKLISLQFPTYAVQHHNHTTWIMHQHRSVYELFDPKQASAAEKQFKKKVTDFDNQVLARINKRFANSKTVAKRLWQYNQLQAIPLYHPPYGAASFYHASCENYIFCPSRLETLKRQMLLLQAARHLQTPVKILLAGVGGQQEKYRQYIEKYQLQNRVALMGHITEAEKRSFYAHALAVFFAPYEEDYGYVTLEAQLSAKAVITCHDSGGVLEFVENEENGIICQPDAEQIAAAIDRLYQQPGRAEALGQNAYQSYRQKNISWQNVVSQLLA